ncbi:Ger(x)C family spore germination protein [Alteribacillus sp. YIM 98480]|uniref:Ger(x)C family spore germination protein n=1 Tax=Alteribacillus sp. YIM 98480 TaxID=2606599 RepID=UPI00131BE5FF|nr:Ger(x)C family spore germination protein [Alteribacillus sp. YIM 98480]
MKIGSIIILLLMNMIFLSGCWSNRELPDLALVSALGIDKAENGQYVGTIQVINPGNVAGGEGTQATGSESTPITTYTASGGNLTEVNRHVSSQVSRRPYYAHTNLLVIGEKLAREEGIAKIFDALERDPEFRTTTKAVIATNNTKAEDIISTLTTIDKIPSNKVIKTLESTEQILGQHMNVDTRDVLSKMATPDQAPIITCFSMEGDENQGKSLENIQATVPEARLQASGIAVLKDGKMIDTITEDVSKGTMWVLNKIKATAVSIDWKGETDAIVYQVTRQKTDVTADMKNTNKPKISVEVSAEGRIGEAAVPVDLSNPLLLVEFEEALGEKIKENIMSSIHKAQELKADYLGFGGAVHRADPNAWESIKGEWEDSYFPEVEVDVTVDAFVRRTGLRNEPLLSNMEN